MVGGTAVLSASVATGWHSGTVPVAGGRLAYHRTGGSGPALVLSHGLTDNGLCWSRFAQAVAGHYDVVMLDARGHGESSRIPQSGGHDPAQDIAEAIDGLRLETPIVMGHSVGAIATAAFANAYPARIAKVILEDPPFLPPVAPGEMELKRESFRRQIGELRNLTDDAIAATGRQTSPDWHDDEFPAWTLAKRQVDLEAMPTSFPEWQTVIDKITAPTLLVYGELGRGGLVTADVARQAMQINPRIHAVEIERAGHNIRRENFSAFLAAVRKFLNEGGNHWG